MPEQFTVDRKELSRALTAIGRVKSKSKVPPILNAVRISYQDGSLRLALSDLESVAEHDLDCETEGFETFGIDFAAFKKAVRGMKSDEVLITVDSDFITCGVHGPSFDRISEAEFPLLFDTSEPAESDWHLICKEDFARVTRVCVPPMSEDETRINLNGIHIEPHRWVSTDGHRLGIAELEIPDAPKSSIVPAKAIKAIAAYAKGWGVDIAFTGAVAWFGSGNFVVRTKLTEGEFPTIDRVIPEAPYTMRITIDRKAWIEGLSSLEISKHEDGRPVPAVFEWVTSPYSYRAATLESCSYLPVLQRTSPIEKIGFNPRYLIDALKAFDSEMVHFVMNNDLSPALITSPLSDDRCIVMPARP